MSFSFSDIEAYGVERWLAELALALRQETYRPEPIRRVFYTEGQPQTQAAGHLEQNPHFCERPRFGPPGCALNGPTWSPVKGSSARVSPNRLSYGCPTTIFLDPRNRHRHHLSATLLDGRAGNGWARLLRCGRDRSDGGFPNAGYEPHPSCGDARRVQWLINPCWHRRNRDRRQRRGGRATAKMAGGIRSPLQLARGATLPFLHGSPRNHRQRYGGQGQS